MTQKFELVLFTDVDFKQYVAYMHNADIPFTIITWIMGNPNSEYSIVTFPVA